VFLSVCLTHCFCIHLSRLVVCLWFMSVSAVCGTQCNASGARGEFSSLLLGFIRSGDGREASITHDTIKSIISIGVQHRHGACSSVLTHPCSIVAVAYVMLPLGFMRAPVTPLRLRQSGSRDQNICLRCLAVSHAVCLRPTALRHVYIHEEARDLDTFLPVPTGPRKAAASTTTPPSR
jgi:hypothetical protein